MQEMGLPEGATEEQVKVRRPRNCATLKRFGAITLYSSYSLGVVRAGRAPRGKAPEVLRRDGNPRQER